MKTEIKFEDKLYSCEIKIADKESMTIEIFEKGFLSFKGKIILEDIIKQIRVFAKYSIEEVFSVFSDLESEKFNIIKDKDEYKLDIAIKILKKEKHYATIITKFEESKIDILKRLKKQIEENNNRIKSLKEEIKQLKKIHSNAKTKEKEENKTEKGSKLEKIDDKEKDDEINEEDKKEQKKEIVPEFKLSSLKYEKKNR